MIVHFEESCSCKGKNLDRLLRPSVLKILYCGPCHGFGIVSALGNDPMYAGAAPDPSGVYRCLKSMEGSGLLRSGWKMEDTGDKPVKVYEITLRGRACLQVWKAALYDYKHSIERLLEEIEAVTESQMNDER